MKWILFVLILLCLEKTLHAQYIYTIKADSVKITNSCDTAELIIENHTQNICGFLFNKGRGRTEFRRGLIRFNDSVSVIGCDTLKMNPWLQGGNRFGTIGSFGTMDNNPIDFYTNGLKRGRWNNTGNLLIGNGTDNGYPLQLHNKGNVSFSSTLSRSNDVILFGGYMNPDDGQNMIISTSDGTTGHAVLMERDGNIGMGWGSPYGWNVGHPTFRIASGGTVSVASPYFYFGNTGGPYNSSALVTRVSSPNEWRDGYEYPNGANYYYFGTTLQGPTGANTRAPLVISGKVLHFNTGAGEIEAVKITDAQNVIIGPMQDNGSRLQVNGNIYQQGYSTAAFGNGLGFDGTSDFSRISSYRALVYQSNSSADQHLFVNSVGGFFKGTLVTMDPGYYPTNLKDTQVVLKVRTRLSTQSAPGLVVNMVGNVGLGIEIPSAQFHTTGSVRFAGLASDNSQERVIVSDASGNLYYRTASSLGLNENLNSDLAVNGRISAQKMLITQAGPWPDYVFSRQYQLPALKEVESFIKQNSHLPGVPSAAEVEKNGLDVAGNQAALLKKIEELTLYVIEQEKLIQKQNSQYNELKQEMAELKALIKKQ